MKPGDRSKRAHAAARARRSAARLYAVQALFQMEATGRALDDVREEFETHRLGLEIDGESYGDPDLDHFRSVIYEAVSHQARIDQLTDRALVAKWPIDRIDPTLRALFRAAGAEIVALGTPPKVAITEYIAVATAFFPEGRERKFVNAVLDHMAREARPESFARQD
jgi:N utilization substance protein B